MRLRPFTLTLACIALLPVPMPARSSAETPAGTKPEGGFSSAVAARLAAEGEPLLVPGTAAAEALQRQRDEILVAAVERRFVTAAATVSDAEVEAFYQAHLAEFAGSERLVLRHIFRRLSVHAPQSERSTARAGLESLRREILAGADFAALAQARSDSQTSRFGGLIAPQARGQLEPSIEARVWRLAVGELSEVVETPIGFHIFRLEQRLPPQNVDPATARQVSRQRVTLAAQAAARERLFAEWLRESGAVWAPERLQRSASPAELLFALGPERITVGGLEEAMQRLPFVAQHTRAPIELLRERAGLSLALWKAAKAHLAEAGEVAERLAEVERQGRIEAAIAARIARRRAALSDADLQPLFEAQAQRFALPARHRVRVLVREFVAAHSPHFAFEELTELAAEVRSGRRDFAAAARELSTDRSATADGDLGWIDLRDLGWWAGTRAYDEVRKLAVGALSAPLLLEVYDATELTDRARGYMLVRVEAVDPGRKRSFAEVRDDVAAAWIAGHLPELRGAVEAEVARELANPAPE